MTNANPFPFSRKRPLVEKPLLIGLALCAGMLLIAAAVFKWTSSDLPTWAVRYERTGIAMYSALAAIELIVGALLVTAPADQKVRRLGCMIYCLFAAYNLILVARGFSSCGCFGRIVVHPLAMFGIDLLVAASLFFRVMSAGPPRRLMPIGGLALLLAVGLSGAFYKSSTRAILSDQPRLVVSQGAVDIGRISPERAGEILQTFEFLNLSNRPVEIDRVETSCTCTEAAFDVNTIEPHGRGILSAKINWHGRKGFQSTSLAVVTKGASPGLTDLNVSGRVDVGVAAAPSVINFGTLLPGQHAVRNIDFVYTGSPASRGVAPIFQGVTCDTPGIHFSEVAKGMSGQADATYQVTVTADELPTTATGSTITFQPTKDPKDDVNVTLRFSLTGAVEPVTTACRLRPSSDTPPIRFVRHCDDPIQFELRGKAARIYKDVTISMIESADDSRRVIDVQVGFGKEVDFEDELSLVALISGREVARVKLVQF